MFLEKVRYGATPSTRPAICDLDGNVLALPSTGWYGWYSVESGTKIIVRQLRATYSAALADARKEARFYQTSLLTDAELGLVEDVYDLAEDVEGVAEPA